METDAEDCVIEARIARFAAGARRMALADRDDLRRTESLFRRASDSLKRRVYPILVEALGAEGLSEKLNIYAQRAGTDLAPVCSFTAAMSLRARRRQALPETAAELYLIDKDDGGRFARALGVPVARRDTALYDWRELPLEPGTVVKPRNGEGSRGVFVIRTEAEVLEIKTGTWLSGGVSALRPRIAHLVGTGFVPRDRWIREDFVTEDPATGALARDFKVFAFYGDCPLIWEMIRQPTTAACWWGPDGRAVDAGQLFSYYPHFDGIGFPPAVLDLARRISREIPAPFLRLDILNGHDGPVLGEFTGHSGNYDRMNREWDRRLGEAFLAAEARLHADLIRGRRFDTFLSCFPTYGAPPGPAIFPRHAS